MSDKPDFFQINQDRLNWECVRQPVLYWEYAQKLADAKRDFEQAKTAVDLAQAGADAAVRERPAKYGIVKVTEPAIKAAVAGHRKYTAAIAEMNKLRHRLDIFQAAINTLDQRKRMIESLVSLRLANYFSEPRVSKDAAADMDERNKRRARRAMDANPDE